MNRQSPKAGTFAWMMLGFSVYGIASFIIDILRLIP